MFKVLLFLFGLFLLLVAIFDVEWFMNLTRSARSDYSFGRSYTRIIFGVGGIIILIIAISWQVY
jgi:hypothetical protein